MFINKYLRNIPELKWQDRVSNTDLVNFADQTRIKTEITKQKWTFTRHTLRKDINIFTRQVLLESSRKMLPGNPENSWRQSTTAELKKMILLGIKPRNNNREEKIKACS